MGKIVGLIIKDSKKPTGKKAEPEKKESEEK